MAWGNGSIVVGVVAGPPLSSFGPTREVVPGTEGADKTSSERTGVR